jgi:glycosyltransferase involved in cell wall biosynthesis
MNFSVIINNYNYEQFLEEAILSVLNQTKKAAQIIIVDDGSIDNSAEIIKRYADSPQITFIQKENGGQLSAFNAAISAIRGDVVAFLDSDDWYEPYYLKNLESNFSSETDYLLSSYRKVFHDRKEEVIFSGDVGVRYLRSVFTHAWLGVPTSGISIRLSALQKILPYPNEKDWKVRADEVLLHSCIKMHFNGRYLKGAGVNYRIHGNNLHTGKAHSENAQLDYSFACKILLKKERDHILSLPSKNQYRLFSNEMISAKRTNTFLWKEGLYVLLRLNLTFFDRLKGFVKMSTIKAGL